MFGSLGLPELLMIFAVILIVFGPRRIPEIGRTLGKALAEFRKATDDLKGTIEREVRLEELKKIAPAVMTPFDVVSRTEPETLAPSPAPTELAALAQAANAEPEIAPTEVTQPELAPTELAPSETADAAPAAESTPTT
jgi:TatA/E family protein of Tat protein translocase